MVTQLQDVANTVAQEKISNQRLRNEEIRRQMANPWSEPIETPTTSTGIQPLQNAAASGNTLASIYSGLLSNYQGMTGTSSNSGRTEGVYNQNTTGQTSSGNTTFGSPGITGRMPGWASTAVGTGLSMAGAGIAAPIGAAATQLMSGNRAGAAGTLGSLFTNVATKGSIPGLGGVVGSLASGLIGDKSKEEIGRNIFNSLLGTGLSSLNPMLGLGYQGLRLLGFDPAQGLGELFGMYDKVPPNFEGGFFGERSAYNTLTSTYGTGYNNVGGAYSNLTGTEGYGTSMGGYSGLGIGNPSSYGGSGNYSTSPSSNSYGGYSPTMNYSSNSGSYWSGSSEDSSSNDSSDSDSSSSSDGGW